jgi:uncharacterized protein
MSPTLFEASLGLLEQHGLQSERWRINFFGGEPTLFPDLIEYACEAATVFGARHGKPVGFSMTTNGTRFDDRMLALARQYQISTMLSIDGNRDSHDVYRVYHSGKGSYDDIVENLSRLKEAPSFSVRMTVSVATLPYLAKSIAELISLGVDQIATSVVAEDNWTREAYDQFGRQWREVGALALALELRGRSIRIKGVSLDQDVEEACRPKNGFGCGAGTTFVFVDARGDIYPCHRYPGYFTKSPTVRIGSVASGIEATRRQYFVEANRASAKQGCSAFLHASEKSGRCPDCLIQGACGGACMAINHNANGDPTKPPPVLGTIRQIMLAAQYELNEYRSRLSPS